MGNQFYKFNALSIKGEKINMENYKGKTLLVVNTASKCGLTPQFEGLENLYQKYKDKDFEILGFPCNQFANQEPGGKDEIDACLLNYGVDFQMFDKVEVNGKNADPIFKYLKNELPGTLGARIKWNFTKFLIDKEGNPVKRFSPATKPEKLEKDIQALLG